MSTSPFHIRLPRRVTAYFLLFGLTAVVWLSVGAFYVARSVNQSRSESACLRTLGRSSARLALDYLKNGNANLRVVVNDITAQSGALYCAILSKTGVYLAHSTSDLVGKPAAEHGGATEQWGNTMRVQYVDARGESIDEYRTPLEAGGREFGTLVFGVTQPGVWGYLRGAAQYAPLAILGPACCMALGAVLLNRMVRPVADIEQQLSRVAMSPSVEGCELSEVPRIGAAALGWNRVITHRNTNGHSDTLGQQIHQSLQKGRQSRLDGVLNSIPDGVATTDRDWPAHVHQSADGDDFGNEGHRRRG